MEIFNTITGVLIYITLAVILSIWILLFIQETSNRYFRTIQKYSFFIAGGLALGSILGSLIYSEIFQLAPCLLCWWQRVFIYPQVIILGVGAYFDEKKFWLASSILAVIGAVISTYHIMLQLGLVGESSACAAFNVSCTKIDLIIFGWLTIPIMALVTSFGILTFAYVARQKSA